MGGRMLHKLWEEDMLIWLWDIHRCTPEFQKLTLRVHMPLCTWDYWQNFNLYVKYNALIVRVWYCSNLLIFHYQLQKQRIFYAGICIICKMFSLFITIILFLLSFHVHMQHISWVSPFSFSYCSRLNFSELYFLFQVRLTMQSDIASFPRVLDFSTDKIWTLLDGIDFFKAVSSNW